MRQFVAVVLVIGLAVSGCGGGGGGSGGESGLVYVGNTDPVVLTQGNAKNFAWLLFGSANTGGAILPRTEEEGVDCPGGPAWMRWASLDLPGSLAGALATPAGTPRRAARIDVDKAMPCDSGFFSIKGSLADDGTGTLAIVYEQCRTGEETVDGSGSFEIAAAVVDPFGELTITDATIRFTLLTVTSGSLSQSASGSMRMQVERSNGVETLTMDMVMKDHLPRRMAKFENLVFVTAYDDPFSPMSYATSMSGRIYDSVEGFADLDTAAPLAYAFLDAEYPATGGPLGISGASGAILAVAPVSETDVRLTLDLDGDGLLEFAVRAPWAALDPWAWYGTLPVAEAGADRLAAPGAEVGLDGTDSSDADGHLLAFTWVLLSVPEGSAAFIEDATRPLARFTPDLAGTYVVQVTVDDGSGIGSASDTATVDVQSL